MRPETDRAARYALIGIGVIFIALALSALAAGAIPAVSFILMPYLVVFFGIAVLLMILGPCSIVLGIMDWTPATRRPGRPPR